MAAAMGVDATTIGKTHPLESVETKTAIILVCSGSGTSAAGIFKFNIQIIKDESPAPPRFVFSCDKDEEKDSIIKTVEQDQSPTLRPLESFFPQTPDQRIYRCAFFRKPEIPEELYLIPMDDEISPDRRESLSPLQYNFRTNTTENTPFPLPSAPKVSPIAAYIRGKIFLLSSAPPLLPYPEPMFESYCTHPELKEWSALPTWYRCPGHVAGYVVLRDQFILVDVDNKPLQCRREHVFYSYNTLSGLWKFVKQKPPPSHVSKRDIVYPKLFGEGLVPFESGDVESRMIYSYDFFSSKLISFSYSLEKSEDHDLSLDLASYVRGFEVPDRLVKFPAGYYPSDHPSGAMSKLFDNDCSVLCVLHLHPRFHCDPFKESSGSIIKLDGDDYLSCTVLAKFHFNLYIGDLLLSAFVQSFFVLQLEEQKNDHPGKRLKNDDLADDDEMDV